MRGWLIFLIVFSLLFLNACKTSDIAVKECNTDADCVKASCCHADSCVPLGKTPVCEGVYCSMDCQENTLDCGQGSCLCQQGKCATEIR
ncbi:MAG TPA: hypothetical protein VJJ21_04785 [Candidatus Nanoarchaeia archaeon]|nr:hypothetical protein [Candidatus Nanoarchaeia archaeon]